MRNNDRQRGSDSSGSLRHVGGCSKSRRYYHEYRIVCHCGDFVRDRRVFGLFVGQIIQ